MPGIVSGAGASTPPAPGAHLVERRRDLSPDAWFEATAPRAGVVVAGLGALARAAFRRRRGGAAGARLAAAGYRADRDAPGEYVLQR